MCVLKFEADEKGETFMGTLLTYHVDDGQFEVTLDFKSISRIMASYHNGTLTVITDKNDQVMEKPVRVRSYNLSGPTGVVTLLENTYSLEVNHG